MLQINDFIFSMMKTFGVYETDSFPKVAGEGDGITSELMSELAKFRDRIKENAD